MAKTKIREEDSGSSVAQQVKSPQRHSDRQLLGRLAPNKAMGRGPYDHQAADPNSTTKTSKL